jgi:microcystin-dependent protein
MSGSVGTRIVWPVPQSILATGAPNAGGLLYTYQTGSNTPLVSYQDAALTIPNENPITLDSAGQVGSVFLVNSPAYKMVLTDQFGTEIWTADPVGFTIVVSNGVPIGMQAAFATTAAPTGWLEMYGQNVSRTDYALLFAAISTTYGVGDGTTTFGLPDKRGRVSIGLDNMGGTPANRITTGFAGFDGDTQAAAGGDQLLMQHSHTVTDPGHTHTLTDPGHTHVEAVGQGSGGTTPAWIVISSTGNNTITDLTTGSSTTGITIASATTGLTVASAGAGDSQNVQPSQVDLWCIFAGA